MTQETPVAGASAGSLIAACSKSGLSMQVLQDALLDLARDCRTGGTRFRLRAVLKRVLEATLPEDIHLRCTGRAYIAVTRLWPQYQGELVRGNPCKALAWVAPSVCACIARMHALWECMYLCCMRRMHAHMHTWQWAVRLGSGWSCSWRRDEQSTHPHAARIRNVRVATGWGGRSSPAHTGAHHLLQVSTFTSRRHLIDTLLVSCYIPW